jgi:hypothetical protein
MTTDFLNWNFKFHFLLLVGALILGLLAGSLLDAYHNGGD